MVKILVENGADCTIPDNVSVTLSNNTIKKNWQEESKMYRSNPLNTYYINHNNNY